METWIKPIDVMRKYLFILLLLPSMLCYSQSSKQIELKTPGSLSMLLSFNQLEETQDLYLTGNMNAKDFFIIQRYMPNLRNLNLKGVNIKEYSGSVGPQIKEHHYSENQIPEGAFKNKRSLVEVVLPNNLINIGDSAFWGCTDLSLISMSDDLLVIGESAFEECLNLTSVNIPQSVKFIGNSAFKNCLNLQDVALNNGLESIGAFAFSNCLKLNKITIPVSLQIIKDGAFANCKNLGSVYMGRSEPLPLSTDVLNPFDGDKVTLFVPSDSVDNYKKQKYWSNNFKKIKPY